MSKVERVLGPLAHFQKGPRKGNLRVVEDDRGCWIWQGRPNKHGYGCVQRRTKSTSPDLAHRAAWETVYGPTRKDILHRCDVPLCVNPSHLFEGTQDENMKDCKQKGRTSRGEHRPTATLTEKNIKKIRRLREHGLLYRQIAPLFAVRAETIGKIIRGERWTHVS